MEYAKLDTASLAHVDDTYYYGAYCRKCKHGARLSLVKLRAQLGDTFPLLKVRKKLRCEKCGAKHQIVTTFLAHITASRQISRGHGIYGLDARYFYRRRYADA